VCRLGVSLGNMVENLPHFLAGVSVGRCGDRVGAAAVRTTYCKIVLLQPSQFGVYLK
jgi:hypothetical protein